MKQRIRSHSSVKAGGHRRYVAAVCWDTWAPGNRTDACRHRCVVPGDVALIPITMAWIGWPLVVPWMFGVTRSLLVPGSALWH